MKLEIAMELRRNEVGVEERWWWWWKEKSQRHGDCFSR